MGQERLVEDLREELVRGEVLVVVGTGVSIQATGGAECASWDGLIRDGIKHAVGTTLLSAPVADDLRARLEGNDVDERLDAGDRLTEALRPDFGRWLRDSVGKLPLKDRSIIDAVHALGAPIATTNYDDLLTRDRGIAHVPWTDTAAAVQILRGHRRNTVLHLHGCFDHPESVILGRQSYQKLLDSRGAQAVQQGIAATRSLLFIGCGEGLSDPNLGGLLRWIGDVFGNAIYRHYRLCLADEQKEPDGRLFYVSYGDKFAELAPFLLRELAPRKPTFTLPNAGFCFGREREVEEVVTALVAGTPQPLPILGGPGMGKTTIALKALHDKRVAEKFRERRWFVRCDGVTTRADLAGAVALALGLPITPSSEQGVLAELAAAPAALVLDNAETPLDADGTQVEELLSMLATIESLALVVTIRGQRRPRGVPWRPNTRADQLTKNAALDVFVAVSGKEQFRTDPCLPHLIDALDGVPLAITLMARYAELFETLQPVWSQWESKHTAMLKDGDAQDRLTNIAVSYELSIGVLREPARRLLSVLAMLPDGVAHGSLTDVFADPTDAANELRRRALVFDEAQRLRMRAPLREYVSAQHPPEPRDERRAVDHYLALAGEGRKVGRVGGAEAVARLAPEVGNLEAMLRKSVPARDESIADAVYGWAELMRFTGLGSTEPIEQIAASSSAAGLTKVAAQSFRSLGDIALDHSDYETALARYKEALPLYQDVGDTVGEANCIGRLGDIALMRSDYDTALARYEEALPLHRTAGYVLGEANCIWGLGTIALEWSDYGTARARYEEALPLYQNVGDVLGQANCIQCLGDIALRSADLDVARARYEEALPLYQAVGDVLGEANCIQGLGDTASSRGSRDDAVSRYHEALALYERIADRHSIGDTHRRLAGLAQDDASRSAHVNAAREAWRSIKRDDLLASLDTEFGAG